jgi:hypothetical protein
MFFSNAQALVLLQIKPMIVELANCYYPWGWGGMDNVDALDL